MKNKSKHIKHRILKQFLFWILLPGGSYNINAQPISLQAAIELALKNNTLIKTEALKTEYAKMLLKSAHEIPKTNINSELGQVNSFYFDTKFGISQSIAFPTVYKKQKNLLVAEMNATLLDKTLKEFELKKLVTQSFYTILFLKEKEKILIHADSLYTNFYTKALTRLQNGESNILEKATAENQKATIELQLSSLKAALTNAFTTFQYLLNTTLPYEPDAVSLTIDDTKALDSTEMKNNPSLQMLNQQIKICRAKTETEQSKLYPDFTLGYINNSFRGLGPNDVFYNASHRFHSVQLSVGVPIFTNAQKAKINAYKLNEQIAASNEQWQKIRMNNEFITRYNSIHQLKNQIKYYEELGMKNAQLISQTANKQFVNGEINYLDYVVLINQTIEINSSYIDAVNALNEAIIELQFITLK